MALYCIDCAIYLLASSVAKLEDYLRKKYNCNFLDLRYSKEDYDDEYQEIKYFDTENSSKDVKIIFDKKNKKRLCAC